MLPRPKRAALGPPDPHHVRFSLFDAAVLVATAIGSTLLWTHPGRLGVLLLLVVAHFFLFCNVVRLWSRYELVWALSFVVACGLVLVAYGPAWELATAFTLPITFVLFALQLRHDHHRADDSRRGMQSRRS